MSVPESPSGLTTDVTDTIVTAGVVAVLRAREDTHVVEVAHALVDAGVRVLEITLTIPGADELIDRLRHSFGDSVAVGAGTVLTADEAERCIDAGAQFVVSPASSLDVVAAARIAGVAAIPGALSPTEILVAHRAGASAVKVFPASAVGPRYIRDVHGPLPDVALVPTGGIGVDDVEDWIRAGSAAVGLGSALTGRALVDGTDEELSSRARRAVAGVRAARGM